MNEPKFMIVDCQFVAVRSEVSHTRGLAKKKKDSSNTLTKSHKKGTLLNERIRWQVTQRWCKNEETR